MTNAVIDVHSHPLVPAFVRALAKHDDASDAQATAYGVALPPWSVEQHIDTMDRNGIDVCVLSVNSVTGLLAGRGGQALAREINEELASLVARYPKRFGAFAAVPMDDMDAAIEESAYALDVLRLDGLSASTHYRGTYLGEPVYDPWFAEMDRRGSTLFVHPVAPDYFDDKTSRLNVSVLEFMFDTTRMVTTMVLSGAKQRFGNVNIIATHAGGTIPFLANRIVLVSRMPWAYRDGPTLSAKEVQKALGSFYFDLTASTGAPSLEALCALVSGDRLLMGFDFPFMPPQTIAPALATFLKFPGFDQGDRHQILSGNARRLFPRILASA